MTLTSGVRLGPYEIQSALGAGGMGEVYKARDTRLDRTVAIKVLPQHVASDPDLKQRFEREARAISSLNHPHICTLYDVGASTAVRPELVEGRTALSPGEGQETVHYLVMEYLDGETLAQRLTKGPLPLDQALRYATEIADALDKAHRQGITHRDLKPGNVMLTKLGAKLLDFGLAKLRAGRSALGAGGKDLSALPTISTPLTATGSIVGTFQYMAPEQLEGKDVDARTDIFAFGAVLYEMVTGRRAFEGKSQASLIGAILERDPVPIATIQPMAPPALDHVVRSCLAKDPDDRWQTARDVERELKWIVESSSQASVTTPVTAQRKRRDRVIGAALAALVAVAIAVAAAWMLQTETAQHISRFAIVLAQGERLTGGSRHLVALSPSGTHVVYVANQRLHLRAMDQLEATAIQGTEGPPVSYGRSPFFSPDGQWIGFWQNGQLKKVAISGGAPVALCNAAIPWGASWELDGRILFGQGAQGIWQVPSTGGTSEVLIKVKDGEQAHGPQLLPGGEWVLFTLARGGSSWDQAQIVAQSLETGERKVLIEGGRDARYVPTGHLVFARQTTVLAVPFDVRRLEVTAGQVSLVDGVMPAGPPGAAAQFAFSRNGSFVYIPGGAAGTRPPTRTLVWVDREGRATRITEQPGHYLYPRISPDGRRLAIVIAQDAEDRVSNADVWVYDLERGTRTRLTFAGMNRYFPAWTPDGQRVTFGSVKVSGSNIEDIYWTRADGSGQAEALRATGGDEVPTSWSPDGRTLAFVELHPETRSDLWTLSLDAGRKASPLQVTPFQEVAPAFSPDGRWLAYVSDESGRYEVYVQPYPGPGGKIPISKDGGTEPVWSRDGRELFYRNDDRMLVVAVSTLPALTAGTPRVLFEARYAPDPSAAVGGYPNYDISPDGKRFVMIQDAGASQPAQLQRIVVVENWFEELKARVPAN